jgi:hypothetical protein
LDAFEGICSDLLSLYGEVFNLGDFNSELLDPGHVLFASFSDLLETFMLHNVAIFPTRRVSGKLLDLFLVSVPAGVNDFYQVTVTWSEHDLLFLTCRLERPREVAKFYSIRRFRDVSQSKLVGANDVKVLSRVRNLGFVLNERLTAMDHFRKVCQRIFCILRCLRPHPAHTPFEVRRRLVFCLFFVTTMVILCLLVLIPHRGGSWGWHSRLI